jgi:hypothetical protein
MSDLFERHDHDRGHGNNCGESIAALEALKG